MVQKNKIIIIIGPTGTGKSNFAVDLAKRIDGAVISADSMQIYREMDVGTAKIMPDDYQGIDHYMLDIIDPNQEFSVAEYRILAEEAIDDACSKGRQPIITGGTGLYIDSLLYPMSYGKSERNDMLRAELNRELDLMGAEYIHGKLRQINPEAADRLHPNNTRRVIRAIEIALSNKTQADIKDSREPIRDYLMIGLNIDRKHLYERINQRVERMFTKGLMEEVAALKEKYSMDLQSMQAIGYKEFKEYFEGNINLDGVKELIKQNTRNYSKRQMTWFKRYDTKWFNPLIEYEEAMSYIKENL